MPVTIPDAQLHELTIEWPSSKPYSVILTGEFDHWARSLYLQRTPAGTFAGTIRVPYGQPTRYKFIVDGKWMVREGAPTEVTPEGYVNNVYWAPAEGVLAGAGVGAPGREKGGQQQPLKDGEEKGKGEKGKVMVEKAVNGKVEDAKQDPPFSASTASSLRPVGVAPNVPIAILPIIDHHAAVNGPDAPKVSNDAPKGTQGGKEEPLSPAATAVDPDRHTHIMPALVASSSPPPSPSPAVVLRGGDNETHQAKVAAQNESPSSAPAAPASASVPPVAATVTDDSEGSHVPTSTTAPTASEVPETEEARSRTPTGTRPPPQQQQQQQITESPKPAAAATSTATTPTTPHRPSSSPLSSPSKNSHHNRSPSKSSSLLGTWKKGGRRISSSLLHQHRHHHPDEAGEEGSLERHGSKATSSSSSNSSGGGVGNGANGDGAGGRRKRKSSIYERLKHRVSDLIHPGHRHGKEKSENSI